MSSLFSWLRKPFRKTERPQRAASAPQRAVTGEVSAKVRAEVSALPSTRFAFSLFEALRPGDRNLAISPYSARVVLAMLWEGATGETRKSMLETLHLDENPDSHANRYERLGRPPGSLLKTDRQELEMITANSLWCDQGFEPKEEYMKTLEEHYWAEVQTLDFHAPDSASRVNRWAHEKTRGRIPTVVDSLGRLSPLVTMNAVYFKGLWVKPFELRETQEEEFTLQDGAKQLVPLMRQSGKYRYAEGGGAQIVRLPYKSSMSMCVVLPPKDMPFPKFCAEMTNTVGTSWTRAMGERKGHLRLPRFRIETQADLSAPLKALGMSEVFDPARATLEGISERKPLYLMGVMQKDFVEVNEEGTEAAAVTHLVLGAPLNPPPPPPPFEMIVNRPFVFAICDDFSGVVVFLAAVVDPLS
jgi:serine protease inhibitor